MGPWLLSDRDKQTLQNIVRWWKRNHRILIQRMPNRRQPPMPRREAPVHLGNDTSETIPPYALCAAQSEFQVVQNHRIATVSKPGTTPAAHYYVNNRGEIAGHKVGSAQRTNYLVLAYEEGADPQVGETYGPKPNQWEAAFGYPGFICLGVINADLRWMLAVRTEDDAPLLAENVSGETIPAYSIVKLTRRVGSGGGDTVPTDGIHFEADKPDDDTFFVGIGPPYTVADGETFPVTLDEGIVKYTDTTLPRVAGATIGFGADSWEGRYTEHDFRIVKVLDVTNRLVYVQRVEELRAVQLRSNGTLYKESSGTGAANRANTSCKGSLHFGGSQYGTVTSRTEISRAGFLVNTNQAAYDDHAFTIYGGGRFLLHYNIELRGHFSGTVPTETLTTTSDGGETVTTGAASAGTAHTHDVTTNNHTHDVDVKLPVALGGELYLQERKNSAGTWASSGSHINITSLRWTIQRVVSESPFSATFAGTVKLTVAKRTDSDSTQFRVILDPNNLTSGVAATDFEVSVIDPSCLIIERYSRY